MNSNVISNKLSHKALCLLINISLQWLKVTLLYKTWILRCVPMRRKKQFEIEAVQTREKGDTRNGSFFLSSEYINVNAKEKQIKTLKLSLEINKNTPSQLLTPRRICGTGTQQRNWCATFYKCEFNAIYIRLTNSAINPLLTLRPI